MFEGGVLLVNSRRDEVIPTPVTRNYLAALDQVPSLTSRVIADADHRLSQEPWQQIYTSLLLAWMNDLMVGAREDGEVPETAIRPAPSLRREPSNPA